MSLNLFVEFANSIIRMEDLLVLPKGEYPKNKALVRAIPVQLPLKKSSYGPPDNKKENKKKELILFNTEEVFKPKKFELY